MVPDSQSHTVTSSLEGCFAFKKKEREKKQKTAVFACLGVFGVFGVFGVLVDNEPL